MCLDATAVGVALTYPAGTQGRLGRLTACWKSNDYAHAQLHLLEGRRPAFCTAPPEGQQHLTRVRDAVLPQFSPRMVERPNLNTSVRDYFFIPRGFEACQNHKSLKGFVVNSPSFQETVTCWRGSRSSFSLETVVRQVQTEWRVCGGSGDLFPFRMRSLRSRLWSCMTRGVWKACGADGSSAWIPLSGRGSSASPRPSTWKSGSSWTKIVPEAPGWSSAPRTPVWGTWRWCAPPGAGRLCGGAGHVCLHKRQKTKEALGSQRNTLLQDRGGDSGKRTPGRTVLRTEIGDLHWGVWLCSLLLTQSWVSQGKSYKLDSLFCLSIWA